MKFAALVLAVLAGCAIEIPENAVEIPSDTLVAAAEAWAAQGLTAPSDCPAPLWVEVSFEAYRDACPTPSCADPSVGPATACSHSCTHFVAPGVSLAFFAGVATKESKVQHMSVQEIQAHETWHVWLDCQGDTDVDHTRKDVWSAAAKTMSAHD